MLRLAVVSVLFCAVSAVAAQTQDLSALQVALEVARQGMQDARAEQAADVKSVNSAVRNQERAQKQLDQARKNAAASKKRYQEAKARYDKAQTALNNVWKQ